MGTAKRTQTLATTPTPSPRKRVAEPTPPASQTSGKASESDGAAKKHKKRTAQTKSTLHKGKTGFASDSDSDEHIPDDAEAGNAVIQSSQQTAGAAEGDDSDSGAEAAGPAAESE